MITGTCTSFWTYSETSITTVFVDTRLWKTKLPRKRFQNFRQSCVLTTDRIEIHQSQPASMTKRRSEGHISGCDWWISIRSVDNTQD